MAAQGKTALVVIDLQNDYFPGGKQPLHEVDAAAQNASRLLHAFREKGLPRFHVRHEASHPAVGFFLPGTPGAEIHETVHRIPLPEKHQQAC
jgi:nicotinamidase-related amidase